MLSLMCFVNPWEKTAVWSVVKAVHGQIRQQLLVHKESKDPEVPELFVEDLDDVLKHSGVPEEKVEILQ